MQHTLNSCRDDRVSRFTDQDSSRTQSSISQPQKKGFSLIEMIVSIAVLGTLFAIAAPSIGLVAVKPANDSATMLRDNLKLTRAKAMSMTTAHRIQATALNQLTMERHQPKSGTAISSCNDVSLEIDSSSNDVWATSSGFNAEDLTMGDGVLITSVTMDGTAVADASDWEVCFDSRGLASANVVIKLTDARGVEQTLEVLRGGATILR